MPGAYVEVRDKLKGKRWRARIKGRRIMIGRSGACHLQLDSDLCSRVHAVLKLEEGRWQLQDMESSNGTYLNEQRIQTAEVRTGDEIRLAPTGLKIVVLELDSGAGPPREEGKREVVPKKEEKPRKPKKPKKPKKVKPPKEARRAKERAPSAPRPPGTGNPWHWIAPLLGLAFGLAVAFDLPGRVVQAFPYVEVMAPATWMIRGVRELLPQAAAEVGPLLYRAFLALWYLLVGLAIARPVRRFKLLLILAALHVAAALLV
jgi:hypothetical protein